MSNDVERAASPKPVAFVPFHPNYGFEISATRKNKHIVERYIATAGRRGSAVAALYSLQWLPMETAPKDRTKFLAKMHDGREPPNLFCQIVCWNSHGHDRGRWMNDIGSEYAEDAEAKGWCRPLAWMPLPSVGAAA